MDYFILALKKYADFSGRARRAEYWYFVLFALIISIALGMVEGILGLKINVGQKDTIGILGTIFSLGIVIPSIAVAVRRLHDTNKSGWWILIGLIPFIGTIIAIIFMVRDSDPGENKYGPNPKGNSVVPPVAPAPTV